jgi:uncharacterized protein YjbI with pentapeptide repeats
MYETGLGVPQDYAEAMKWYRLAAEQGHTNAQSFLGTMYKYGKGARQDNIMAHMWYNIGAANGNELGGANRDKIAKTMTPAAIEKAKAMAGVCLSSNYKKCAFAVDPADLQKLKDTNKCVECDLSGADLMEANLSGADLSGAKLMSADLRDADLRGSDLIDANLEGAILESANLRGAAMRGVILCNTTMPDGSVIYSGC